MTVSEHVSASPARGAGLLTPWLLNTLALKGCGSCRWAKPVGGLRHEEHERPAREGESALLELAWKDAEDIAAIAESPCGSREKGGGTS
jgi:hypothetical protein